jgi:hypothetical protein
MATASTSVSSAAPSIIITPHQPPSYEDWVATGHFPYDLTMSSKEQTETLSSYVNQLVFSDGEDNVTLARDHLISMKMHDPNFQKFDLDIRYEISKTIQAALDMYKEEESKSSQPRSDITVKITALANGIFSKK